MPLPAVLLSGPVRAPARRHRDDRTCARRAGARTGTRPVIVAGSLIAAGAVYGAAICLPDTSSGSHLDASEIADAFFGETYPHAP